MLVDGLLQDLFSFFEDEGFFGFVVDVAVTVGQDFFSAFCLTWRLGKTAMDLRLAMVFR